MFDRLIHADWSVTASKRWMATAERSATGWAVGAPELVGTSEALLNQAFQNAAAGRRVLAGFDFPIGVPTAFGTVTGFDDFRQLLLGIGEGAWSEFFEVAKVPSDIGIRRPFYPAASTKGVSRAELVAGLGAGSFDALLRVCERRTEHRQAACSLFWTLGGNQVGKGALSGWREIVRPALQRGASLWPFDGTLAELAKAPGVVVAETYPAEAYRMVGAGFLRSESKRQQGDRLKKSDAVVRWGARHEVIFSDDALAALRDGFGSRSVGEDRFDAFMGLLKMIEVVEGRRAEQTEREEAAAGWEGWILGR